MSAVTTDTTGRRLRARPLLRNTRRPCRLAGFQTFGRGWFSTFGDTRECLAIDAGHGQSGHAVAATLSRLRVERGLPQRIYCDNGGEFVSAALDLSAYTHGVILDFSRRSKPTHNATIESFNGRLRDECLNAHWFVSPDDAQQELDAFQWDCNENHPHRAL